jgi:hypothetical protein
MTSPFAPAGTRKSAINVAAPAGTSTASIAAVLFMIVLDADEVT